MTRMSDLPGIELMEARFFGDVFEPHRHDTYAIGLTMAGVQRFRYRGEERRSLVGQIILLHPDEEHDGGAGTEAGLQYRMLYLEPALVARALGGRGGSIPFVAQAVVTDAPLRSAILAAAEALDPMISGLSVDDLIIEIAEGLLRHAGEAPLQQRHMPWRQVGVARDFLEANARRNVRSAELETLTGTDRFVLSRAFRSAFGTSPHRYLLMRRLHRARMLIEDGTALAAVAADTGFSDQSHLSRHFKKTYGVTPGRWGELSGSTTERDR